jgi:hypothetical protein
MLRWLDSLKICWEFKMKYQANKDYISNDVIMTPEPLCKALVDYIKPNGIILEPCKGSGNFLKYLPKDSLWCEISEDKDFFDFNQKVDYIITNPPWSQIKNFLKHSLEISNNVCFVCTINHLWTKARLRLAKEHGFGIKGIVVFDTPPKPWPPQGFQVGMFWLQKGYLGDIKFSEVKY